MRKSVFLALALAANPRAAAFATPPPSESAAAPALLDNMDDAPPVLRLLEGGGARLVAQAVEGGRSQFGAADERLTLAVPAGESAQVAYDLPAARVLGELRLAAWVSCSRPGLQIAATVVLPRSIDPQTGAPRRLLIRSGTPLQGGEDWELVTLTNLPQALADQARVARALTREAIDEREAYVSQLVILAPGGPGVTELWVDQITVHGVLLARDVVAAPRAPQVATVSMPARPIVTTATRVPPPRVPRLIQWQGEPFEMLHRMGFQGVWMGRGPTAEELAEARRLGMVLVCPPPTPEAVAAGVLGPAHDGVMAWDLGQLAADSDIDLAHRVELALEQYDPVPDRATVMQPIGMPLEASRIADVLLLGRATIGSTFSRPDYAAWLSQQRRFARAGTPIWAAIDSHASPRFLAQSAAVRGGQPAISPASFSELSLATAAAMGVLPQGYFFQSQTSLAGGDEENRIRALSLELNNLRLGLVQAWLAYGKSAAVARTNRDDLTGLVLKVERSHLIVPLRWPRGAHETHQLSGAAGAPGDFNAPSGGTIFVLPGVPETAEAYLLSIAGSSRLPTRRVTGGLEIAVERLPDDAFVLLTEDGFAFSQIERYLREHAPRAARMRVELASLRRQQATIALRQLPPELVNSTGARQELARVDAQMKAVVETIRTRDHAAAFACAAEAEAIVDGLRERLSSAVAPDMPPGVSPLAVDFPTLADAARINQALCGTTIAFQPFTAGEFEDLAEVLASGWQRLGSPPPNIETAIRLSPEAPAAGRHCLELEARQTAAAGDAPPVLAGPPVWMTSPPLIVPPAHLVEIIGLVRVTETPIGSADPLLVFDSIGGEEAALRIEEALSWTPFRLVRATGPGAECRLTIALGGVGRVQVDGLRYRFIPLPTPPVPPIAQRPGDATVR